jgi:hypothetical protein
MTSVASRLSLRQRDPSTLAVEALPHAVLCRVDLSAYSRLTPEQRTQALMAAVASEAPAPPVSDGAPPPPPPDQLAPVTPAAASRNRACLERTLDARAREHRKARHA